MATQKADPSAHCFESVVKKSELVNHLIAYLIELDVLMSKRSPASSADDWLDAFQVVVPFSLRNQGLSLAHDHPCSGHTGPSYGRPSKTYWRALKYFVWTCMKGDVARYCHTCHTCQIAGKPNQIIPPALLQPILIRTEPFERIIVDCVGPLPKTHSGNYLLTLVCCHEIPRGHPYACTQIKDSH